MTLTISWDEIAAIATALGVIVTALGLFFVALQIRNTRKAVRAQFINELGREAQSMYDTYTKLIPGEDWSSEKEGPQNRDELSKVIAYLGFFARIKFLMEEGAVDLVTIDRMFVFRFFLAAHNRHVQEKILYSDLYQDYWRSVFVLYRDWVAFRQRQGRTTPWDDHSLEKFDPVRYAQLLAIPDDSSVKIKLLNRWQKIKGWFSR